MPAQTATQTAMNFGGRQRGGQTPDEKRQGVLASLDRWEAHGMNPTVGLLSAAHDLAFAEIRAIIEAREAGRRF